MFILLFPNHDSCCCRILLLKTLNNKPFQVLQNFSVNSIFCKSCNFQRFNCSAVALNVPALAEKVFIEGALTEQAGVLIEQAGALTE